MAVDDSHSSTKHILLCTFLRYSYVKRDALVHEITVLGQSSENSRQLSKVILLLAAFKH